MLHRLGLLLLAVALWASPMWAKPPIEAFGEAEMIRSLQLSPDGTKAAYFQRDNDKDFLVLLDLATNTGTAVLRVDELRARFLYWAGNDYIVLLASRTRREYGFAGRFEQSFGFAHSLKTGKTVQLLRNTPGIFPAQEGLGVIAGIDPDGQHVYMPAYMGAPGAGEPNYDLVKVNLDSGRGLKLGGKGGSSNTRDWILNAEGEVVVREDFSFKTFEYRVLAPKGASWREVYAVDTRSDDAPPISILGLSAKTGNVLISKETESGETAHDAIFEMSLADGAIGERLFVKPDTSVEGLLTDTNGIIHGVRFAGMFPSYQTFDADLDRDIQVVSAKNPGAAVTLVSWSADFSRLIFYIEGDLAGPRYAMLDRAARLIRILANTRPDIKPEHVAEVSVIEYKARDGLKINGLIAWPVGVPADQRKKLPMVVMPHGGPEAYDAVGYDWQAQFLANEGYLVLQPNFRGSAGFGAAFADAGRGEWGGKMQDDITDGVKALARMGWVDPSRVCIMGWSYGGYAALAGGATTPDLYKCVVAIAGVSDLREMLVKTRQEMGSRSPSFVYWRNHIGDPERDREKIDAASPVRLADKFQAPVLLVHGTDDTVVPAAQSDQMNAALERAGKPVRYLRIKGDDHSLVDNESRRNVLREVSAFLASHIGSAPAAAPAAQ